MSVKRMRSSKVAVAAKSRVSKQTARSPQPPKLLKPPKPPSSIADDVRRTLKDGGSAEHAKGVQWFFKEEIQSHGWYTADLRQAAARVRRTVLAEQSLEYLVTVADDLFSGRMLEEKVFAVVLLQSAVKHFEPHQFKLFESWLDRVSSWADHDALACYLLGPMMAREPRLVPAVFRWAKSPDRWHRRAAAVALIRGVRNGDFVNETARVCRQLLTDKDDMVQKGLGWLLREMSKANRTAAVPLLMTIRARSPRMVLRTACETLPADIRAQILAPAGC
jgi:3-methyladenine DNA glycosylase AlkD